MDTIFVTLKRARCYRTAWTERPAQFNLVNCLTRRQYGAASTYARPAAGRFNAPTRRARLVGTRPPLPPSGTPNDRALPPEHPRSIDVEQPEQGAGVRTPRPAAPWEAAYLQPGLSLQAVLMPSIAKRIAYA